MSIDPKLTSAPLTKRIQARYGKLAKAYQEDENAAALEMGGIAPEANKENQDQNISNAGHLYNIESLEVLPDSVKDVSLGCGNPLAIASLKAGEHVLDLGSGGGIDCFLAAEAVGEAGFVIGVDITDEMLRLARENQAKMNLGNVEFRKGRIEALPVESESIDVILSNCVIDISPDKAAVFSEAFRVLKPGGRLSISDTVIQGELSSEIKERIDKFADAIITPLISLEAYLAYIEDAGFRDIEVTSLNSYGLDNLEQLDQKSRQLLTEGIEWHLPKDAGLFSARISAIKP